MMQDDGTLSPWMQRWVARTRVISTLLFTYVQVREYASFQYCVRRLVMCLSVAYALTPRRACTDPMKVLKCWCSFKQVLRGFLLFLRLVFSRHFYVVLDW